MNKCLYCGNPVKNKYCNVSCQNKNKPKKIKETTIEKECLKCGNLFKQTIEICRIDKAKKHCSYKCSNSRIFSEESKKLKSEKLKGQNKIERIIVKCVGCENIFEKKINSDQKFCNASCVSDYNTKNSSIHKFYNLTDSEIVEIFYKSKSYKDFYFGIGYNKNPRKEILNTLKNKLLEIGLDIQNLNKNDITNKTKKQLFDIRSNWQSARSSIAKHSRKVYNESAKPKECKICGYNKHFQVAHIISVSSFSEDTKIIEINNIDNLIALCPNHHWEYDNNLLIL